MSPTTNYNADQGRSSGAQVALVTKSGTNNFHGSVYEYNRNTATSANDYFVKHSQLDSGEPNSPPKLIRNIYGVSLGGPFVKDKLFFFANWEGTKQREETSAVRTIPTDSLKQGILKYPDVDGNIVTLTPGRHQDAGPAGPRTQSRGHGLLQRLSFPERQLGRRRLQLLRLSLQGAHQGGQELLHRPRGLPHLRPITRSSGAARCRTYPTPALRSCPDRCP